MADIGVSVLARLKNKAVESGRSMQLCLQLFCQEEFLRRVELSKYADNLVLKGGLFLYTLTNYDSRVTMDVDFMMRWLPNSPDEIRGVLEEILASDTSNDFITFEIREIAPIAVEKKYSGIRALMTACIKNTRTPFGVDFGVGDVIVPHPERRTIPVQLPSFKAPTLNTYSLETTVAEKIVAILDLMDFSSRMKDYYDLFYLANRIEFDTALLAEAMRKTFANRGHEFTMERFETVCGFASDAAMQFKWQAFTRKIHEEDLALVTVVDTIRSFLSGPMKIALERCPFQENSADLQLCGVSIKNLVITYT